MNKGLVPSRPAPLDVLEQHRVGIYLTHALCLAREADNAKRSGVMDGNGFDKPEWSDPSYLHPLDG